MTRSLLEVKHLQQHFVVKRKTWRRPAQVVKAVHDVSFQLQAGQTLGLVGESGCGKSTLGRSIVRLLKPTSGEIWFDGQAIHDLSAKSLRPIRENIQMIFQDPYASLSPRRTVRQILREPLDTHHLGSVSERDERIRSLLNIVGLDESIMSRFPHEFSGGQRQRISVARALAVRPKLIVADEAVSALDVSVQAQVLNLIKRLQKEFGIAFLFIAHDLSVVRQISDHVAVMYLGQLMEYAPVDTLFAQPKHPYTRALLDAVPIPNPHLQREKIALPDERPSPFALPNGCLFENRCAFAKAQCAELRPDWTAGEATHRFRCHYPLGSVQ